MESVAPEDSRTELGGNTVNADLYWQKEHLSSAGEEAVGSSDARGGGLTRKTSAPGHFYDG